MATFENTCLTSFDFSSISTCLNPKFVLLLSMKTSDFNFDLPIELIAQEPYPEKLQTPMLVFKNNNITDQKIKDIINYLQEGDVLVFNNARVIKAKLQGKIKRNNALINVNLDQLVNNNWQALCKPAKKIVIGDIIEINQDFFAKVIEKKSNGIIIIKFNVEDQEQLIKKLDQFGQVPLPPYIKRDQQNIDDQKNYQNCYAKTGIAVACPTAGLHFNQELLDQLSQKKIKQVFVTLNVGAGTFLPVKSEFINDHQMHQESFSIDQETSDVINHAKKNHKKIIAVGTTSLRVLESSVNDNEQLQAINSSTKIFITPGYKFKIIDGLLTNFHLPKSTLFMLVASLVGTKNAHQIYQHAIAKKYRFYSYGDCSLLFKNNL